MSLINERYVSLSRASDVTYNLDPKTGRVSVINAEDMHTRFPGEMGKQIKIFQNFYSETLHIKFEKLDNDKAYKIINDIIVARPELKAFFIFHVKMCGNVFTWNFKADCPKMLDYI